MTNTTPIQETWQEEFDVIANGALVVHVSDTKQYEEIKSFISTLLQRKERETIEECQRIVTAELLDWEHIDGEKLNPKQEERFMLRDSIRNKLDSLTNLNKE